MLKLFSLAWVLCLFASAPSVVVCAASFDDLPNEILAKILVDEYAASEHSLIVPLLTCKRWRDVLTHFYIESLSEESLKSDLVQRQLAAFSWLLNFDSRVGSGRIISFKDDCSAIHVDWPKYKLLPVVLQKRVANLSIKRYNQLKESLVMSSRFGLTLQAYIYLSYHAGCPAHSYHSGLIPFSIFYAALASLVDAANFRSDVIKNTRADCVSLMQTILLYSDQSRKHRVCCSSFFIYYTLFNLAFAFGKFVGMFDWLSTILAALISIFGLQVCSESTNPALHELKTLIFWVMMSLLVERFLY